MTTNSDARKRLAETIAAEVANAEPGAVPDVPDAAVVSANAVAVARSAYAQAVHLNEDPIRAALSTAIPLLGLDRPDQGMQAHLDSLAATVALGEEVTGEAIIERDKARHELAVAMASFDAAEAQSKRLQAENEALRAGLAASEHMRRVQTTDRTAEAMKSVRAHLAERDATIAAVRELADEWVRDALTYPVTDERARYAKANLDLCTIELRAALDGESA